MFTPSVRQVNDEFIAVVTRGTASFTPVDLFLPNKPQTFHYKERAQALATKLAARYNETGLPTFGLLDI